MPPLHNTRPCVQVRLGEKETLDATLAFFEDRYDRLATLEFYQVIASEPSTEFMKIHLHAASPVVEF